MLIASETTIAEAWENSLRQLLGSGSWVPTQRGMRALEIQDLLLCVSSPMQEPRISPLYSFSRDFMDAYIESVRSSFSPGESIKTRIFEFGDRRIDQAARVVNSLRRAWYSRRAIVSLWDPVADPLAAHPPCAVIMQFMVRGDSVHLTSVLRSNDAWLAALPDMISLTDIQRGVAQELGCAVGSYTQLSVSFHIYEPDILPALQSFGLEAIAT